MSKLRSIIEYVLADELAQLRLQFSQESLGLFGEPGNSTAAHLASDMAMDLVINQMVVVVGDQIIECVIGPALYTVLVRDIWVIFEKDRRKFEYFLAGARRRSWARAHASRETKL